MTLYRPHIGSELRQCPLIQMTEEQVIRAAIHADVNTTAAQAARNAVLACCSSIRRGNRRRARRREMIEAGLQANAVPQHLWKYATTWLRFATWLVPPPWGTVLAAVLWVVDQLIAEGVP